MVQFKKNYSRNVFFQFLLLSLLVGFLILVNHAFLLNFYFKHQETNIGYIVNGSILTLFLIGISRLIYLLLYYSNEENALAQFIKNVQHNQTLPTGKINKKSLIYNRYISVLEISKHNVAVNHSALAATLSATESTRLSLPRFISNILILTGVFGTILSLSIALLGASDIIDGADGISGMSIVIHGMSTALSTTATAIVCYLFFGYFYMKLTDVQTELLSGIEQATTLYIMPRFTFQTDSMLHEVGTLVKALHEAARVMNNTQADFAQAGHSLNTLSGNAAENIMRLSVDISEIKSLLADTGSSLSTLTGNNATSLVQLNDDISDIKSLLADAGGNLSALTGQNTSNLMQLSNDINEIKSLLVGAGDDLSALTGQNTTNLMQLSNDIKEIKTLLRNGFRLPSR